MSTVKPTEFEVGGQKYQAARLSAMDAFHVSRKLALVLVTLKSVEKKRAEDKKAEDPAAFAQMICMMSSDLNNADVNASVRTCLSGVSRQISGGAWAPVLAASSNVYDAPQLMMQDIDMMAMLQIVWHVMKHSGIVSFFSVNPVDTLTAAVQK